MAARKKAPTKTLLGGTLKDYRQERHVTQEDLADTLGIAPRILRMYENGERQQDDINELRRVADLLGIDPARLGLASAGEIPRTPEQVEAVVERAWRLIDTSRIFEARTVIERLLPTLQAHAHISDPALLRSLARTYHAAGYVTATGTRSYESYKAIPFYHEMEVVARELGDDTLINVALTYQGDMFTRLGEPDKGIIYLEAARDTTPKADNASLGNGIQLLARAYLRIGNIPEFDKAMARSEELTYTFEPMTAVTRGHYNLGTVLEEYGRSYGQIGQMDKALAYLDRAQAALPQTVFWQQVVDTARALALVQGDETNAGAELAAVAAQSCYETGNIRMLDRIYMIEQFIERRAREYTSLSSSLRDVLAGGRNIEF